MATTHRRKVISASAELLKLAERFWRRPCSRRRIGDTARRLPRGPESRRTRAGAFGDRAERDLAKRNEASSTGNTGPAPGRGGRHPEAAMSPFSGSEHHRMKRRGVVLRSRRGRQAPGDSRAGREGPADAERVRATRHRGAALDRIEYEEDRSARKRGDTSNERARDPHSHAGRDPARRVGSDEHPRAHEGHAAAWMDEPSEGPDAARPHRAAASTLRSGEPRAICVRAGSCAAAPHGSRDRAELVVRSRTRPRGARSRGPTDDDRRSGGGARRERLDREEPGLRL
jgi:hypothetical protein